MDTLKVHSNYNKEDFIKSNIIRWKIGWLKYRKRLRGLAISSIVIWILGEIASSENEPNNPFIVIGIGMAIIATFMFFVMLLSKINYKKKVKEVAVKYDEIKMDCSYEFTNDSVKYWDKEKHLDLKWENFTSYSIYKNYLVLVLNNSMLNSYLFEKKESEIAEYNMILEIVKTKLEYKEIK